MKYKIDEKFKRVYKYSFAKQRYIFYAHFHQLTFLELEEIRKHKDE